MQTQEKQFRTKNGFVSVITLLWSIICSVKFTKVLFLPVINFQMFHKKATITISINVALSTVLCGLQLAQESELRLLFETRNNEVYQIYFKMIQINHTWDVNSARWQNGWFLLYKIYGWLKNCSFFSKNLNMHVRSLFNHRKTFNACSFIAISFISPFNSRWLFHRYNFKCCTSFSYGFVSFNFINRVSPASTDSNWCVAVGVNVQFN